MIILLDNGHGVDTQGKRSPVWDDGSQLFEYEFNRDIVSRIAKLLKKYGDSVQILTPETYDVPLYERVRRANEYDPENTLLVSVHANAGGGTGFEVFTSKGETRSDRFANMLINEIRELFPTEKVRSDLSDNDPDKEANFYILKHTRCSAVLTENLFMDYEPDCRKLMHTWYRQKIAEYHANALVQILENDVG